MAKAYDLATWEDTEVPTALDSTRKVRTPKARSGTDDEKIRYHRQSIQRDRNLAFEALRIAPRVKQALQTKQLSIAKDIATRYNEHLRRLL